MEYHPLDRLLANHPFADMPQRPVTLGTGYQFGTESQPAELDTARALALVAEMIRADPAVAHSLARQVGYDKFVEPLDIVKPFPESFHYTELAISDRGPPKAGTKPSRCPARYKGTLKFAKVARQSVKDIWSADFDLYAPARWTKKLDELSSPTKCRTPFTADQRAWAEQVVAAADHCGHLIGFAYMKPRAHGGTHYVPFHALLVAPDFSEAFMLALRGGAVLKVALPPFSSFYADGRALAGNFIKQSRGAIRTRELKPTHTGYVDVVR